jgi:hypothetical protein
VHWKRRGTDEDGEGIGTCFEMIPAVLTGAEESCAAFTDRLSNRPEVETWQRKKGA